MKKEIGHLFEEKQPYMLRISFHLSPLVLSTTG